MQLTEIQIRKLELSRSFGSQGPTIGWLLRQSMRSYLLLLAIMIPLGAYYWQAGTPALSAFFAGLFIATVARDYRWHKQFVRDWPLSREITDWDLVDELLANARRPAP